MAAERHAPGRGRLFRSLWPVTSYLVTHLTVTVLWVFFFALNRTRVTGREHVGEARNTLVLSNHQSMLDSFLVGLTSFFFNATATTEIYTLSLHDALPPSRSS